MTLPDGMSEQAVAAFARDPERVGQLLLMAAAMDVLIFFDSLPLFLLCLDQATRSRPLAGILDRFKHLPDDDKATFLMNALLRRARASRRIIYLGAS